MADVNYVQINSKTHPEILKRLNREVKLESPTPGAELSISNLVARLLDEALNARQQKHEEAKMKMQALFDRPLVRSKDPIKKGQENA